MHFLKKIEPTIIIPDVQSKSSIRQYSVLLQMLLLQFDKVYE